MQWAGRLRHVHRCTVCVSRQFSIHFGPDADRLQEILARNLVRLFVLSQERKKLLFC